MAKISQICYKNKVAMICIVGLIILTIAIAVPLALTSGEKDSNVFFGRTVLDEVPLIDGHNDWPNNLYILERNRLQNIDLNSNLKEHPIWGKTASSHTDIPRLLQGKVGGQFWVAYVGCDTQYKDATERTLEQIDVIKRMIKKYPKYLKLAKTSDEIIQAYKEHKIASMICVEGGHSMDSRLGLLRIYHELGVRYMTLTHNCPTPWADSSQIDDPSNANQMKRNITQWGRNVIWEMNRLGIMVDISHVSHGVMLDVLKYTKSPVIFSHSSSFSVFNHHRNVRDDILNSLIANKGIIMINFYPAFVGGKTIDTVIEHLNYVRSITGSDHIGLGADYDGVSQTAEGLEDVSKYPDLFDMLADGTFRNGTKFVPWSRDELKKLAGLNLLRVMKDVEDVSKSMESVEPFEEIISKEELIRDNEQPCMTNLNSYE